MNPQAPPPAAARAELQTALQYAVQQQFQLSAELAAIMAEKIAAGLSHGQLSGEKVYIPAPNKAARDARIAWQFTGTNMADVCQQFAVSRHTVYRACQRHRARNRAEALA